MNIKRICVLFGIALISSIATHGVFAQENTSEFVMIANVNLVNQGILAQNGRVFKVGVNMQNKIGTQTGIFYGVKAMQKVDGQDVVVDQFAVIDSLTLKQNEYAYKEFDYTMPTAISGEVRLYAFLATDKGITLATAPLGTESIKMSEENTSLRIKNCTFNTEAKNISCVVANTGKSVAEVNLTTTIKQASSIFSPVAMTLPITIVSLKAKEEKVVVQNIDDKYLQKDVTLETVIFDKTNTTLLDRTTITEISRNQTPTIDNVLIEQTTPRDYVVKIISLVPGAVETKAKVTISSDKKICETQEVLTQGTLTSVPLSLKKSCDTALVTVEFVDAAGVVTDSFTVEHKTLFPEAKSAIDPLWVLGGLLLIALIALIIKRRKTV